MTTKQTISAIIAQQNSLGFSPTTTQVETRAAWQGISEAATQKALAQLEAQGKIGKRVAWGGWIAL